jgi:hypothetical protein
MLKKTKPILLKFEKPSLFYDLIILFKIGALPVIDNDPMIYGFY